MKLTLVLIFCFVYKVSGHARLISPPSRASMWRFGFPTPADYNDNEGFCGGYAVSTFVTFSITKYKAQWGQNDFHISLKFIYSEKTTKFCGIFTLFLSYVVPVKSKVKILQNFVAFSEYMNFTHHDFQSKVRRPID